MKIGILEIIWRWNFKNKYNNNNNNNNNNNKQMWKLEFWKLEIKFRNWNFEELIKKWSFKN